MSIPTEKPKSNVHSDTAPSPRLRHEAAILRRSQATRSSFRIEVPQESIRFFARDELWGEVRLTLEGAGDREVEFMQRDFAEIDGLLRFGYRVAP